MGLEGTELEMWKDDLRGAAEERARRAGRAGPSIRDLLEAAIDRTAGEFQLRSVVEMLSSRLASAERPSLEPATEDDFESIFGRATALAFALDQEPAAEHVVVVASLHPDSGDPDVRGFVQQIALQAVGSFGVDERSRFMERLSEAAGSGGVVRRLLTPGQAHLQGEPTSEPCCVRCGSALDGNVRLAELSVAGREIRLLTCTVCGAAQAIGPDA